MKMTLGEKYFITILIILFILPLFIKPYGIYNNNIRENFRGKRSRIGGARGAARRAKSQRGKVLATRPFRGGGHNKFYRRSSYRRYPYGSWGYPPSYFAGILSPYYWGSPYGYYPRTYYTYDWFDYRNCPAGCVANSFSPSGFSCRPDGSPISCLRDYDCVGCNNPIVTNFF